MKQAIAIGVPGEGLSPRSHRRMSFPVGWSINAQGRLQAPPPTYERHSRENASRGAPTSTGAAASKPLTPAQQAAKMGPGALAGYRRAQAASAPPTESKIVKCENCGYEFDANCPNVVWSDVTGTPICPKCAHAQTPEDQKANQDGNKDGNQGGNARGNARGPDLFAEQMMEHARATGRDPVKYAEILRRFQRPAGQ